jgi:hypothetical protein
MPTYIGDVVNQQDYLILAALTAHCNEIWENRRHGTTAATAADSHCCTPLPAATAATNPFERKRPTHPSQARKMSYTQPGPLARSNRDWFFYHTRFGAAAHMCDTGCSYQENKLVGGGCTNRSCRSRSALLTPPAIASASASATDMTFLPAKTLIFLHDIHSNFRFLADSGASLSILAPTATEPPTGMHLGGCERQD